MEQPLKRSTTEEELLDPEFPPANMMRPNPFNLTPDSSERPALRDAANHSRAEALYASTAAESPALDSPPANNTSPVDNDDAAR